METKSHFINEISVSYKRSQLNNATVNNSQATCQLIKDIYNQTQSELELKEYFFMVLLNRANKPVGYYKLSEGGIGGTVVDIRIAFATALKGLASAIVLAHNHPSGNLVPSEEDKRITKRFVEVGKLLEIVVLDHVIVTTDGYYSFADEGLI
jgi:DNA repair protein RadC